MTTPEIIIAAMAAPAAYGGVKAFATIDRRIESIRKTAYKLAEICEKADLEILQSFFEAIAIGDKSGVIAAARQLRIALKPDKFWDTMDKFFFNQLKYRLKNRPDDELRIVRAVDENRVAKDALLANTERINTDNAERRKAETTEPTTAA